MSLSRRAFLVRGSAVAVAAASIPWTAWAASDAGMIERSARPVDLEAPLDVFTQRITPIERFYVRSHFDAPSVDPSTWRLRVGGLVERPVELALADLDALEQVTVEAVLQCSGNGRGLMSPRIPGVQWGRGAMGNARWTGPRLKDVLARAGVKADAKHLHMLGADRPVLPSTPRFFRSIPLERALDPDTLVATRMNDVPLPPLHGAPARIVVPGWVGDDWMKWIGELTLDADEAPGFFMQTAYRFPITPGEPGKDVPADQKKPMTWMNVKSVIASPGEGAALAPGRNEVVGVAFSGAAAVAKVEVSTDGGTTWGEAVLEGEPTRYGFRVFRFPFRAKAGPLAIAARATDEAGAVQPAAPVWNPSGYLHNAIHVVHVHVGGA